MLKELVGLIAAAERINTLAGRDDCDIDGDIVDDCQSAIDHAIEAVGKHDIEKRKTDEAICLLFRAVHEMNSDTDDAAALLRRAEVLLGYAPLTPAKG